MVFTDLGSIDPGCSVCADWLQQGVRPDIIHPSQERGYGEPDQGSIKKPHPYCF